MKTLQPGTLLYRGIDSLPNQVRDPLSLNSERVLWLATSSLEAQTYIPDFGGSHSLSIPHYGSWEGDDDITPDGYLRDALVKLCGSEVQIHDREHACPPDYNPALRTYGPDCSINDRGEWKWGRPTSWSQTREPWVAWPEVCLKLKELGYAAEPGAFLWVKTTSGGKDNLPRVHRADAQLEGTLAIYEVTAPMTGLDRTNNGGTLADPDYHRARKWAELAVLGNRDFVAIDDYLQSNNAGNVGHTSIAVTSVGISKLRLVDMITAKHPRWPDVTERHDGQTAEEKAWRASASIQPERIRAHVLRV